MRLLVCVSFLLVILVAEAQDTVSTTALQDSSASRRGGGTIDSAAFAKRIDSVRRRVTSSDTALVNQINKMEEYANRLSLMAAYFGRDIDTINMSAKLDVLEQQLDLASKGIDGNIRHPNLRNLLATRILMVEMEKQLEKWQHNISVYNKQLGSMRKGLDSMARDSSMRIIPNDSLLALQYADRVIDLSKRFRPINALVKDATIQVGLLQGRIVRSLLKVNDQLTVIDQQINGMRANYFERDEPPIWAAHNKPYSNIESLLVSWDKSKLLLRYYLNDTVQILLLALVVMGLFWFALQFMIKDLKSQFADFRLHDIAPHIKRSVFFTSLFVSFALLQLLLNRVPMVLLELVWLVMLGSLTRLVWSDLKAPLQRMWVVFSILFLWACLENLLLENGIFERYLMMLMASLGIVQAFYMFNLHRASGSPVRYFTFFVWLFIIQEGIGLFSNVFGYYTFGRAMAVGGYFNFVLGLMFFLGIKLIKEMVALTYEYFRHKEAVHSAINLLELRTNIEKFLPLLAWIGWGVIFAKNLNFYDPVINGISQFLSAERTLGTMSFSFGSVAIFFTTIWIATLLAQLIAFVLGGGNNQFTNIKKTRFGNSVLVMKLGIISAGILVAFAASGIPLDKITIIIGALGVGIGFGLQNIVNNLVSGVILAFEKPIEIGDQIEVGGRLGKIKEIGIRSSKLATFEGAEVIIPNGDLLSQHVVNWTLSNNHRRVEILVGVQYGSHLQMVKKILENLLFKSDRVDKYPKPLVLVHNFNSSSIDFRLLFWTNIENWVELKSDMILAIDESFKAAGVEIPFPQIVVHQANKPDENAPNDGAK